MDRFRGQNDYRGSYNRGNGKRNFNEFNRSRRRDSESISPPKKRVKYEEEVDMAPWISSKTKRIENTLLRFHCEIIEFAMYLLPSPEEHKKRSEAFDGLKNLIESKLEGCSVKAFGSFRTKMYLPDGDIDVVKT